MWPAGPTAWLPPSGSAMRSNRSTSTVPASGGGAVKSAREVVAIASTLLPEELVRPSVQYLES